MRIFAQNSVEATQHFKKKPKYGRQTFQTGAWEISFKSPGCPAFLEKVRLIDWREKKILVHHAGTNPAPPCYDCGNSGPTVVQCTFKHDARKQKRMYHSYDRGSYET
ncbi:hypothetical protein PHMEG_00022612 [Phytophthora megakarya]|uniref:Uncharacterized protein n=1 Tax=Phytophthora megakarya TaxID=4795 RepID=A0A225VIY6_9STRA|nr:hypothetical protein PHMEG_00022612 [Phytophthora megakarya]